jgi:hypothetical protein
LPSSAARTLPTVIISAAAKAIAAMPVAPLSIMTILPASRTACLIANAEAAVT